MKKPRQKSTDSTDSRQAQFQLGQPRGVRPHEDRLDDVIEVATRLFREKGFRATRLDDISNSLGVTRAALYYYFHGKREMLEEICARAMSSSEDALLKIQELEDPEQRLLAFTQVFAKNMASDAAKVFSRDNRELDPESRHALMGRANAINDGAEEIFRYGIKHGVFDPELKVSQATRGFLTMLSSISDWHRPERDGAFNETVENLVMTFIRGVRMRS